MELRIYFASILVAFVILHEHRIGIGISAGILIGILVVLIHDVCHASIIKACLSA